MEEMSFITLEFLEFVTGKQILSFKVTPGTEKGDNFMSSLIAISAHVKDEPSQRFYILKCYPSEPFLQKFLSKGNHFYNELCFYQNVAKDLSDLTRDVTLSIPPFIHGRAIDSSSIKNDPTSLEVFSPLDNYILMTDLRKSLGYKMADKRGGLDFDHVRLAFIELANLHALSWTYQLRKGMPLNERFPFLRKSFDQRKAELWLGILSENVKSAVEALSSTLDGAKANRLIESLKGFEMNATPVIELYTTQNEAKAVEVRDLLRSTGSKDIACLNWRVLCHGDCWVNNLLYRYDGAGRPVQVTLIDFPGAKMGCPTLDLATLIYTSTRRELRRKHLQDLLKIYHDQFVRICDLMGVPVMNGLSVDALEGQFHISKLSGLLIALISLPMNLISKDDEVMKNDKGQGETLEDMLKKTCSVGVKNKLYNEWVVELVEEMCDEGVI